VLNRGDLGVDVAEWQTFLRAQGYCALSGAPLAVTSDFDEDTEVATRRFQQDHGLEPTGVLCPRTDAAARSVGWRP
jgi:murein L,D-transpeptidase YcbB/YkuD